MRRREVLRAGVAGLAGLTLPRILRGQDVALKSGIAPHADSVIVIFLNGGPSHLDMWDMKPDAPKEIRGEFRPISTSADGIQLCEHLPRLARVMHHATLVRSMRHKVNNAHAQAVYVSLTGHDRGDGAFFGGATPDDHPAPGSVLTQLRPPERTALPYVAMPFKTKEGAGGPPQPGFYGGILGQAYDPFWVLNDPSSAGFGVPDLSPDASLRPERLQARRELLAGFESPSVGRFAEPSFGSIGKFHERALDLLTSADAQKAFRIEEESGQVRDSYGRNIYGQSALLARRLIEAGTRAAYISWAPDANATWDTHGSNFKKLRDPLLPQLDAAAGSLIADLEQRGLLDRTLVAILGDFGRTPRINAADGGRDHWNNCYTVMLAGGGVKGGFVHGSSDRTGALPDSSPVSPGDIIATCYHLLGLDPESEIRDPLGRPFRLVREGRVLHDLLV